jgi:hypothetical protein
LGLDAFSVAESDHFGGELDSDCGGDVLGVFVSVFDEFVDEVGFSDVGVSCQDNLMTQ